MSDNGSSRRIFDADFEGGGLLIPSLHPQPLPLTAIVPAPCTQACPAGVQVKAYVSLMAERRFAEALEVIRHRCPLPGICGRVCHHPCEAACNRGKIDEPVAIRSLKRLVADMEREFPRPAPPPGPRRSKRVVVVGSGPAGLTAAYDLSLLGYPVTVFEAEGDPGGMLRYGITAYRLPREILDAEIEVIARAGVEIQTGRRLGGDFELEGLLRDGYAAALLAIGAQHGRSLGLDGEKEYANVEDALAFLRRVNAGDREPPGRRVVVIGGGSTAVEAARAALRLGAETVEILYRRYREEMLAGPEEIEAAEEEGIRLRFLVAPSKLVTEGKRVTALECIRVGLGEPDAGGRRRPIAIPGSEFTVETDRILAAVGQRADLEFLAEDSREATVERGLLRIDNATSMTPMPGVFAAGDVVSGPATVIEAIAAGHAAAESIRHFLEEGRPDIREQRPEPRAAVEYELPDLPPIGAMRIRPNMAWPEPGREFAEVEQAFSTEEAVAEARRCLRCGPCGECWICAPTCQRRHLMVRIPRDNAPDTMALVRAPASIALGLDQKRPTEGWLMDLARPEFLPDIDTSEAHPVTILPMRARILPDRCRGCAKCEEICPFHAVRLESTNGDVRARIEPSLCRGCNLCTAVCPNGAAVPGTLSPEWWGHRIEDALHPETVLGSGMESYVVLACQRRAGALEARLDRKGVHVEVIRFRCVGQVDAGMLLELSRQGARKILVAGCSPGRCRFGSGALTAAEQVGRARSLIRLSGGDDTSIAVDWSADRAGDPLDGPVRGLVGEGAEGARHG